MSYADLIAEIAGTTEPAAVALIEELMRSERPALDSLTAAEFAAAVRDAVYDAAEMEAGGWLPSYCEALGLAVPPGVTGSVTAAQAMEAYR